jgi:poly [ADP-ribose] polymerase
MEVKGISSLLDGCIIFRPSTSKPTKSEIELAQYGALVVRNCNERVTHFSVDDLDECDQKDIDLAHSFGIKIVSSDYFDDCISQKKLFNVANPHDYIIAKKAATKGSVSGANKRKFDNDEDDDEEDQKKGQKKDQKKFKGENTGESTGSKKSNKDKGVVKVLKKGSVPVDPECHSMVSTTHVLEEPSCVWSCMLNQTNIQNNNNKFYHIQLLEIDNSKNKWWVWNRWGRIGNTGQSSLKAFTNLPLAKKEFEKKFKDKTKNGWDERQSFKSVKGHYTLIGIDYGSDDDNADDQQADDDDDDSAKAIPDSNLEEPIQNLIKLICDVGTMKKSMISMNFDIKKVPLGQLKKVTLDKAASVLTKLEKVIKEGGNNRNKIVDLSNQFYTLVPHYFGYMAPPAISDINLLQKKYDMLEDLGFMQVASSVIREASKNHSQNPIDAKYTALNTTLTPLSKKSLVYKQIVENVKQTHGPTHTEYKLQVSDIFEIFKQDDEDEFEGYADNIDNNRLLWHGSRITNWFGILSQGLQIAPPSAPVTGYMFGKGLYFADMVSKSTNYCHASKSFPEGIALLCEVALGTPMELTEAKYIESLNKKYHSVKGVGKTMPDPADECTIGSAILAQGKGIDNEEIGDSELLYNEFIVYNRGQCKMKYLVHFNFDFK